MSYCSAPPTFSSSGYFPLRQQPSLTPALPTPALKTNHLLFTASSTNVRLLTWSSPHLLSTAAIFPSVLSNYDQASIHGVLEQSVVWFRVCPSQLAVLMKATIKTDDGEDESVERGDEVWRHNQMERFSGSNFRRYYEVRGVFSSSLSCMWTYSVVSSTRLQQKIRKKIELRGSWRPSDWGCRVKILPDFQQKILLHINKLHQCGRLGRTKSAKIQNIYPNTFIRVTLNAEIWKWCWSEC